MNYVFKQPFQITAHPVGARAWTGGTKPQQLSAISTKERQLVRMFFRRYVLTHASMWGGAITKDAAKTLWVWARYDAHATARD